MNNPTADEVFAATYSYLCGEIDEEELTAKIGEPNKPHGEVVERRCLAFYDVVIYEDGYEDWFYIGD